jgi:ABC-2 type transport system ATP-binding protein
MASDSILSLSNVTVRYGPTVPVDRLCLDVFAGEIFGLLGPNGSGKSTTLSAIAGALPISSGSIQVCGVEPGRQPCRYRRQLGLVPQELAFYEDLSAETNLLFFGRLYGLASRELRQRVEEALVFVQLTEHAHRPARTYSGGMQRRLNLACAVLHRPALLLLDEPTVGLDVQSREAIFASLRTLRERGTALVFTTHHLEEAELLCDRLGIMDQGRLVAQGTLDELLSPASLLSQAPGRIGYRRDPAHVRAGTPSLERVFLELTGRRRQEC